MSEFENTDFSRDSLPFNLVGLGGTFDHLHKGHKKLLKVAFTTGKKVAIALTTEKLLNSKEHGEKLESYQIREKNLRNYIEKSLNISKEHYSIIPLEDPFGPAITEEDLEAHISSEESYKMAFKINEKRREKGLDPFILIIIPYVRDESGERYSSTKIRENL